MKFKYVFTDHIKSSFSIDDLHFKVAPNSIYFTNPSNYRTFRWEAIEDVSLITFDEFFLKNYVSSNGYEEFPFLLTETISPKIVSAEFYQVINTLYNQIKNTFTTHHADRFKIIGHLVAVLLYRIKDYCWNDYDPIYEGNRSSQIVKTFKKMLAAHYRDVSKGTVEHLFKLQDYADAQHLHPTYLSNVIKSKTGKSITDWIIEKNITEAKLLLKKSSLSVKEISYRLGFSETAHFSNYFKKYTSLSPIAYRETD